MGHDHSLHEGEDLTDDADEPEGEASATTDALIDPSVPSRVVTLAVASAATDSGV